MTHRSLHWLPLTLIVALGLLLQVACGGAGQSSSAPQASASPAQSSKAASPSASQAPASPAVTEVGVTDDKILIGSYIASTGATATIGKMMIEGSRAYFNRVNDEGGVNGRKIEWLVEDGQFDSAKTVAVTKKLVESDKVFAIVAPQGTQPTLALRQYIIDNKVPLVGPQGSSVDFFKPENRYLFSFIPPYLDQGKIIAEIAAKKLGAKSVSIFHLDEGAGKEGADGVKEKAKELGLEVRAVEPVPVNATDVSSQALKLKQANADVLVLGGNPPAIALLLKEIGMLNWQPKMVGLTMVNDANLIKLAGQNAEGVQALAITFPTDADEPAVVQYRNDMKKYFPDSEPNYYSLFNYAVAKTFVDAVKGMGKNVTRDGLIKALESMKGYQNGVMAPLTFTEKDHVGIHTAGLVEVKNGKWVVGTKW